MKFVRIGDVVLNRDLVESVVVNVPELKEIVGRCIVTKKLEPKGVKVVLANDNGHHIFENETLESVMDKLNQDYDLVIGGNSTSN